MSNFNGPAQRRAVSFCFQRFSGDQVLMAEAD
jgi:hypothetical protein